MLFFILPWSSPLFADECVDRAAPNRSKTYAIHVDSSSSLRHLQPEFFGFNLLRTEFQLSLWDSERRQVVPEAVEWLRAFPGAVYRFPGGHEASFTDWRNTVGLATARVPEKSVDWLGPKTVEFGLREYLEFVQTVGGQAWYVLNLFGRLGNEQTATQMSAEAGELAAYWSRLSAAGLPQPFRWELGNELDRDRFRWNPGQYNSTAKAVMGAVMQHVPKARFVAMSQDWEASRARWGLDTTAFNRAVGSGLGQQTAEFAAHLYYDNLPWGLPIPKEILHYCRNLRDISSTRTSPSEFWITEHARTPAGEGNDPIPKHNWPQTADLNAAVSVADMVIALAAQPAVRGAFLHALHGSKGPWPLLHRRSDGSIVPSAVYWALRILRDAMPEVAVATRIESANKSGYAGGYDLRAIALADIKRTRHVIWLVNRAASNLSIALVMPVLANATVAADVTWIAEEEGTANNYTGIKVRPRRAPRVLRFDAQGRTALDVAGNAVMTVVIPAPAANR